jgi:predicted DCC family thiol-disulfide oxidoreductase YuxK
MAEIDLIGRSSRSIESDSAEQPTGAAPVVTSVADELRRRLALPHADTIIIYDGQCVFCSAYVRLLRLRAAVGQVELLDGRAAGVAALVKRELDLDLNEGMLVIYQGQYYFGSDAMTVLSALTGPVGVMNRLIAVVFRSRMLSGLLYPLLRLGRRVTLRLLGRPLIDPTGTDSTIVRRTSG